MTNLSANKRRPYRPPAGGITYRILPLTGYTAFEGGNTAYTVYEGALVFSDISDVDGYYRPVDSGVAAATADVFGGIAMEKVEITSSDTANGAKEVQVAVNGVWGFPVGALTVADIGECWASDDDTISGSSTNNLAVGVIVDVDDTYVWVDIGAQAGRTSSTTT